MKTYAQTVIIGAGIVGCSAAYYLAKLGAKDVLVIDKGELFENDGSTSHAPGGVNPLSNNTSMQQMASGSVDLYESLPKWKAGRNPLYMVGGLDLARTENRINEVKRLYTNSKGFGLEAHIVGHQEIRDMFPLIDPTPFKLGLFTPRKPVVAGPHISGSLSVEATKMGGTRFVGHTKALDFVVEDGRIVGIKTNNPEMPYIECERALLCTNIWTPALTAKLGVKIPLQAAEHQYLRTNPLPELSHVSERIAENEVVYPSVRDLDGGVYYRHWWDSMGIGNYHHKPLMVDSRNLGESADHPFTAEDFVDARKLAEEAIPALRNKDVTYPYKINGMFSFTIDGMPIMGETNIGGFWVASALWITNAGGAGKVIAEWMTYGEPSVDTRGLDVNRFLPYQTTEKFIQIACSKAYAEVHDVNHPSQWTSRPRNIKHTPFHQRHKELGAVFLPSGGLEMPYWLEENQRLLEKYEDQVPERGGWAAQYWSRVQGAEHLAMRESAGMFDLTSLAIIEVSGAEARKYMSYVCTNSMNIKVGRVTYTLMCTPKGGIKRDVAVARKDKNRYWMFTGIGTLPLEMNWMERLAEGFDVTVSNLSQSYAAVGLFGPNARKVLEKVTPNDVSNEAFPFYSWQNLEIGMANVYAMRISYVGELGWELHMPMDEALAVRDLLWDAGREFDLVACGVGAMRSMRVEKGYRVWGGDIHTEHNPFEAGMDWMVNFKKKGDFVGRDALAALKEQPLTRKLVTITIDDPNGVVTGNEPVCVDGAVVGQITTGAHGYNVGKYIAFAYVAIEAAVVGTAVEIEYLGEPYSGMITEDVLFDAENERMRA